MYLVQLLTNVPAEFVMPTHVVLVEVLCVAHILEVGPVLVMPVVGVVGVIIHHIHNKVPKLFAVPTVPVVTPVRNVPHLAMVLRI